MFAKRNCRLLTVKQLYGECKPLGEEEEEEVEEEEGEREEGGARGGESAINSHPSTKPSVTSTQRASEQSDSASKGTPTVDRLGEHFIVLYVEWRTHI